MTFRQGAMALVLAGLLSGCVAGGSSSTSAPKPGVCPADKSDGANHALLRSEPPGGERHHR